ncbi:MAG: HAD family hydrolase [Clostridia bacterium]|nr:HAD family hydrolase [Clostridia bacterium]
MYTFMQLKKATLTTLTSREIRLVVLSNVSTQFFSSALQGYAKLQNINLNILDTDYNQIDFQLTDINSETYKFSPDYILLYISTEKLYEEFLDTNINERQNFADSTIERIKNYWHYINENTNARIIQLNFTEINDNALGNFSNKVDTSFVYQIRKLNYLLNESISQNNAVYPLDLLSVQLQLGASNFFDPVLYYSSKMAISINSLPYVAKSITDVLLSLNGQFKKCVILDLDNTLWGGTVGDLGPFGIEIGELGRGHAFTDFQRWLKQLKDYGIILAVCSKNNEDAAKEPFIKLPDMVLKLSDISVFVANWEDKASNIRLIQETLNIGFDSMVFIDDNPFERNLVKSMIPEITVPELPEDPALYLSYLQNLNLFEVASVSKENASRTKQYQEEFERKKTETLFTSIDDYLKSLEMSCIVEPFNEKNYPRIAQLTQRSNQFNLRTIRYTESEIESIAKDNNYLTLTFSLHDKFGDYGLISVIILEKVNDTTLFINTWLMSCRVLKRGVEEFIINKVINTAKENSFTIINAEYIPTAKNAMVKDIYKNFDFTETSENHYTITTDSYSQKENFIKEE